MVVTQPISSLVPKVPRPPAGQRTKRLSVSPLASPDPDNSSEYHLCAHLLQFVSHCFTDCLLLCPGSVLQTGAVLGIIFAAFMMGVILMGGLWCIYNYTGNQFLSSKTEEDVEGVNYIPQHL